jgi:hypothetical protein
LAAIMLVSAIEKNAESASRITRASESAERE